MRTILVILLILSLSNLTFAIDSSKYNLQTIEGRINFYCDLYEEARTPYVWGASFGLLSGDCSGQVNNIMNKAFKKAGIFFKRETAFGMWIGRGGWGIDNHEGNVYTFSNGKFPSPIFFSYSKMADHVGIIRTKNGEMTFSEASSSKGYYKRTSIKLKDYRYNHILGYKGLPLITSVKEK